MAKIGKNRNNALASVDPKGRVVVPQGVREHLAAVASRALSQPSKRLIMTTLGEPCVVVYPECEWERIVEQFRDMGMGSARARAAARQVMGLSEAVDMDGTGRVVIPGSLAEHASIKDKALFLKMPRGFEIWDPDTFHSLGQTGDLPPELKL